MLATLKLLLPALLPSWRFFDFIAPSPRIQFTLLSADKEILQDWKEFRPRPATLPFTQMLWRMLWNPRWNETLFLVSCAERLLEKPTLHSENEILRRISHELTRAPTTPTAAYLQFRLLLIQHKGSQLEQSIVFQSRIEALPRRETK